MPSRLLHPPGSPATCVGVVCLVLSLIGCGGGGEDGETATTNRPAPTTPRTLEVEQPWVRPAPQGGTSALYLRLVNGTSIADTLLGATFGPAEVVEIHESFRTEDGTAGMRPIGPVSVAPKSRIALEPGGKHMMLIGLNEPLVADSTVSVDLQFANAGLRRIQAPVRNRPPE